MDKADRGHQSCFSPTTQPPALCPLPLPCPKGGQWFKSVRHQLRHGESEQVIAQLAYAIKFRSFPVEVVKTLTNVHDYLETHRNHINYQKFKELGLPLGSGIVESACKWLIQQRFKGVGMRWSEDGFNHLLHLRLAWGPMNYDKVGQTWTNHPERKPGQRWTVFPSVRIWESYFFVK